MASTMMETHEEHRTERRFAVSAGLVAGVVVAVAAAALVVQNTDSVTVQWFTLEGQQPLWLMLLMTAVAGVILAKIAAFAWRHRRES